MSDIRHVAQEHPYGCVVACFAMVTGLTYAESARELGFDPSGHGLTLFVWQEALARHGFAVQFLFQRKQTESNTPRRSCWPIAPWAPAHFVQVRDHSIVMLRDGSILDPAIHLQSCAGRRLSDYSADAISQIAGIFPVGSSPDLNPAPAVPASQENS